MAVWRPAIECITYISLLSCEAIGKVGDIGPTKGEETRT
jgi:hypothetical protein